MLRFLFFVVIESGWSQNWVSCVPLENFYHPKFYNKARQFFEYLSIIMGVVSFFTVVIGLSLPFPLLAIVVFQITLATVLTVFVSTNPNS